MQPFETGSLLRSKSGHDKDDIFVIIGQQGEYVWIADGKRRTVEKPKRKKKIHLYPICHPDAVREGSMKLLKDGPFRNEDIKYAIKLYRRS